MLVPEVSAVNAHAVAEAVAAFEEPHYCPVMICEASPPVWRRVLKILKDFDIFLWNKELDINVKPTSIDSLGMDLFELCDAVDIFL